MNSHIIKLKTNCNLFRLKLYITRFLKKPTLKSRYIILQLKFYTINNNIINVGKEYILDIKNLADVKTYRFNIELLSSKYLEGYEDTVNKIVIDYSEITRKEYLSYKKQIRFQTFTLP